ncbi:DegV domain-containing protein [Longispora fulva]|uniref:DegV family protein with EDD domain n=1 Tax=Longispora fulva TaxID=619741 RepID=A0A8J7GPC5_9ACTN|nr:DegV family protein [Longispora fulva]MBG6140798.1 DegV family protein with EDD domain [Longispora fulva]GIG60938.1 DegV domain-containing protein [Longispora fulva]
MSRRRVAVVTDSTGCLPPALVTRHKVTVVPLYVLLSGTEGREGIDVTSADVAAALRARRYTASTSRPTPEEFAVEYRRLLDAGAPGVVSVHLSAKLSGTHESALLAAREFGDKVVVVDAGSTGMGLGFATLAAARAAASGAALDRVAAVAADTAAAASTYFYVDTLEFLRRGGRIGAASALLGTALAVKPILHVEGGEVVVQERVRTASRALARLIDLAVAVTDGPVDLAVHHLAAPDRAADVAEQLRERLGERLGDLYTTEVGAVVAAHVGPGLIGVVVSPRTS